MNAFTWLVIGHLLGDWILQNHWMAKGKKQGLITLAGTVHYAIYTATVIGILWLSGVGDNKSLAFYALLCVITFVSHLIIDATDIVGRWMRFYRQSQLEVMRMMVDQTLHFLKNGRFRHPATKREAGSRPGGPDSD